MVVATESLQSFSLQFGIHLSGGRAVSRARIMLLVCRHRGEDKSGKSLGNEEVDLLCFRGKQATTLHFTDLRAEGQSWRCCRNPLGLSLGSVWAHPSQKCFPVECRKPEALL